MIWRNLVDADMAAVVTAAAVIAMRALLQCVMQRGKYDNMK